MLHPTILHFISLCFEYNLLPLSLFLIIFFSKKLSEQRGVEEPFKTNGFELVLIEAFANLSLGIRIFSDSKQPFSDLAIKLGGGCLMLFLYLIIFFGIGFMLKKTIHTEEIGGFTSTFYSTFISWCLRIIVIGYFSELFQLSQEYFFYLFGAFLILLFLFSTIISTYFLNWNIQIQDLNAFIKTCEYSKAKKIGSRLIRRTKGRENQKYMLPFGLALAGTAFAFFLEGKIKSKNFDRLIVTLEEYIKEPMSQQLDKQRHKLMLIALYYKKGDKKIAKAYVNKYLQESNKLRYINAIDSNTLEILFNT